MAKIGKSLFLVALTLLCISQAVYADVKVQAEPDRKTMNVGDTFIYTISVQSDQEVNVTPPNPPSFDGFDLMNQWTEMSAKGEFVFTPNGGQQWQSVRRHLFHFQLQAQRAGAFRIGSTDVVVNGKAIATPVTAVQVFNGTAPQAPSGQQGAPQGAPDEDDEEDVFSQLLRRRAVPFGQVPPGGGGVHTQPGNPSEAFSIQMVVDKSRVYQGEQVTVSWYLLTTGMIRDLDTLKYPDLRGFWKEDIEIATQLNFQQEVINGVAYKKALLASAALFPMKAGTATIDSYKAKATVIAGNGAFGAFGIGQPYTFTKASKEAKVEVMPLPNEGKPKDFSGAVGQFNVSGGVETKTAQVNRPVEYKIRFEGRGNAKLIDLPPLDLPKSLELYEQKADAKFFPNGTSYKDFTLLLIPREAGELNIPPVSVSVFDPQAHKYISKTTPAVTLHVMAGDGSTPIPSTSALKEKDKGHGKSAAPFQPELDASFSVVNPLPPMQVTALWVGVFGLLSLALAWKARREFEWGQKKQSLQKQMRRRFKKVMGLADKGAWREVGAEGTNAVYFVLGEISGLGGANVAIDKLWRAASPSVRSELEKPVGKLLASFEMLSFAPEAMVGELKDKAKLKQMAREMEKLMARAVQLHSKMDSTRSESEVPSAPV